MGNIYIIFLYIKYMSPFCSLQDGTGNIFNLTLNKEETSFQPLPKEYHSTAHGHPEENS